MAKAAQIRIGTSGWSYGHWRGNFYPENLTNSKMFDYYSKQLNTVEINSSFYRLPLKETFEKWRDRSPENFLFAVKASRFITHIKKLKDCGQAIEKFSERASGLGEKIGPVLLQLPPGVKRNAEVLRGFLRELPNHLRYSFEFRNPDWFHPEIYSLLAEFKAALCIYELNGQTAPLEVTTDFVHVRLHGPDGKYRGRYSRGQLRSWQEKFSEWAGQSRDIFCFFDNDERGFAALNAVELQQLVRGG
jgi:uncharacterized protein YecE (DUF72 family)